MRVFAHRDVVAVGRREVQMIGLRALWLTAHMPTLSGAGKKAFLPQPLEPVALYCLGTARLGQMRPNWSCLTQPRKPSERVRMRR